ncbi:MAG: hypothetical protein NVS1B11_21300 [Terriglobales bacterium]
MKKSSPSVPLSDTAEQQEKTADVKDKLDTGAGTMQRIDCSPENLEQGLAKLVLGLVELLRQLLERQAIRRMEGGSLKEEQIEKMGEALMTLEAKIHELAENFGLTPADLNIDLGPLGTLLKK